MYTIVDYTDSTTAAQTDTDIPLATDSHVTSLNSHPIFPIPLWIQWVYGLGNTMSRVRISTPRLKPVVRPVIAPVDISATPTENDRVVWYYRHPIMLNPVEEVQMLRSNNAPGGGEQNHVVLAVGDNQRNVPQGDMYTARATTVLTPTANTWTTGTVKLDDTLQVGRYSIIGMRAVVANGVALRLIFPGAPLAGSLPQIRPGVLVHQDNKGWMWEKFRWGYQGELGQFESFAVPAAELMSVSNTANPDLLLDIVNVRIGARAS